MATKKRRSGGGGPRVFISKAVHPASGMVRKDWIRRGDKAGTYDVHCLIGCENSRGPQVTVDVLVNGAQKAHLIVREPGEVVLENVRPDSKTGNILVEIKMASGGKPAGSVTATADELQKAIKPANTPIQNGPAEKPMTLKVHRLDSDGSCIVQVWVNVPRDAGPLQIQIDPDDETVLERRNSRGEEIDNPVDLPNGLISFRLKVVGQNSRERVIFTLLKRGVEMHSIHTTILKGESNG